jgi:hypothetical protein
MINNAIWVSGGGKTRRMMSVIRCREQSVTAKGQFTTAKVGRHSTQTMT